ncbi:MAG: CoA pyrophosphatase [Rhizobiaceae bacterium]|nr:CoA pyrophosphatase [Rhizobiaceae bacterium]
MPTAANLHYTVDELRRRVAADPKTVDKDGYGDHRWNPDHPRLHEMRGIKLRDAAVLVPVVDHPGEASVILTKRNEALRNHSGQVAFPGGRIDATDPDAEFAALRETDEEIGLHPDQIEIVGRMPDYVSGSGYRIAPVIGIVRPGFRLALNRDEVDTAFEVPLRFLMDPANHLRSSRDWNGVTWAFFDMPYGGQRIWGVTAGIIRSIYERYYA